MQLNDLTEDRNLLVEIQSNAKQSSQKFSDPKRTIKWK